MNPALFSEQLTAVVQTAEPDEWFSRFCGLLRTHTTANVLLTDEKSSLISQALLPDELNSSPPDGEAIQMTLPIFERDTRIGLLTLYRRQVPFTEDEKLAALFMQTICTALLRQEREKLETEHHRCAEAVKAVINTLSFSELESSVQIFKTLGGDEGLLVAGRVADQLGVTRSVVVNALRKLEGAGMIETRSLGMKGTYIRVISHTFTDEIKKLSR